MTELGQKVFLKERRRGGSPDAVVEEEVFHQVRVEVFLLSKITRELEQRQKTKRQ